ncbi:acyl-CoA dehydrogenase family protein [Frankia sp. AgB1.9]|uniref:acyl-CoA dehydrogenase family protein n=1 Tax=unclassified Frankia TaxID=2632575 RepID=UPI001933D6D7|nr:MULTISPECIES: acyl-CoA dehydrogenase family protein [unclassified Frankia]MBL7491430.1 acyl-CoA dehydrogenase family protein [Frankia sp. AgW1.1]MBL7553779.1 acyl-CoA dehydrogenase family protein [Frankia sp. AgB1.9]MBL7620960.1 acyl-CoA dehydrogenase family protein [Frankia sp. AgB1.8]
MDFRDDTAEAAFRSELRAWLSNNTPGPLPADPDARTDALGDWHRRLAAAGFVGLTFPTEYGGRGLPPTFDAILNDELGLGGYPPPPAIHHITNAIRLFGSAGQKTAHLPGMLSCAVRWCQGFSEPNAGSDLASIRTRGVRTTSADGLDVYTVDGQKIWTSEAVWSQWCLLLCRTEPDERAHRSLSMLLVPLDAPGVQCRPIVTAGGGRDFAEVFFDSVTVPAENLLGSPGQGWEIAMQLLGYERGPGDIGWVARLIRMLALLENDVRSGAVVVDETGRRAIAKAWVTLEALRLHVQRTLSSRLDGSLPGPEGSIDKLLVTEADQLLNRTILDARGAASLVDEDQWLDAYFWSRAQSVFGGTQQIQRDIVARRFLGIPAHRPQGKARGLSARHAQKTSTDG